MKKWDGPSRSWPTPHTTPLFLRSSIGGTQQAPFRPRFWRPQELTRGHCTMAFCCTVQRSSVLVVKRPEVLCCRQRSFSSFQNLHRTSSLLLKHPVSNKQSTRESRSFWFCHRKAVFALSKAELRHPPSLQGA